MYENERLDDLQINNLYIIQRKDKFCFGADAVLLSHFAAQGIRGGTALDLCSGNGAVALLLSAKTAAKKIAALEIQEDIADMAARSVEYNNLQGRISIVCGDVLNAPEIFGLGSFDYVVCNPPYKRVTDGLISRDYSNAVARFEILCTLDDIVRSASDLIRNNGKLFMVHRPHRLAEIFEVFRKYKIEPKRVRFVHSDTSKNASMVLIEGSKYGNSELMVEPPLFIYDESGNYTKEVDVIYGRGL